MASFTEGQFSRLLAHLDTSNSPAGNSSVTGQAQSVAEASRNPFSPQLRRDSRSGDRRNSSRRRPTRSSSTVANPLQRSRRHREDWHRGVSPLSAYYPRYKQDNLWRIRRSTRAHLHPFYDMREISSVTHQKYWSGRRQQNPSEVTPTTADVRGYFLDNRDH